MKMIYRKLIALKKIYLGDYPKRLSLLMLLFFILFGMISLYFLLDAGG